MHYFKTKGRFLYCEDIKVEDLARKYQTPLYVYSRRTLIEHFTKIRNAFGGVSPLICYSVKAASSLAILRSLVAKGAGLDVVSGGELYRAKLIGCKPKKIVYASVGKTEREIREAIRFGVLMFNVESQAELSRIDTIAKRLRRRVDVSLRINPDVRPKTHRYITTAKRQNKFGIPIDLAGKIFLKAQIYPNINLVGVHIHIGSQITESAPFVKAIRKVLELLDQLKKRNIRVRFLNIGGGLGIVYDKEKPQTAKEFAGKVLPMLEKSGLKIILEPGRFIVGNAGILVTKVLYIKQNPSKRFIIVDAAMNDLLRPALYGAYHKIAPVVVRSSAGLRSIKPADIVGPVCESGFPGKEQEIERKRRGLLGHHGRGSIWIFYVFKL